MRYSLFCVLLLNCCWVGPSSSTHAADPNDFLVFSTTNLPGRLFVPPAATLPGEPRPLVVFLHGAGERGTNNFAQVNGNIDNLLDVAQQRGALLYAPQASGSWVPSSRTTLVMDMVDQALSTYNVDPNRLYVTGLSMGGGGTWNMLSRYDDRFAAGVPIAGVRPAGDFDPSKLVGLPTWAFHARNDNVVVEQRSQEVINAILPAAGEPMLTFPPNNDTTTTFEFSDEDLNLHYTEWPTGGHGIWGRVYADMALRDWMFAQSLPIPEPSTAMLIASVLATGGWRRIRK